MDEPPKKSSKPKTFSSTAGIARPSVPENTPEDTRITPNVIFSISTLRTYLILY